MIRAFFLATFTLLVTSRAADLSGELLSEMNLARTQPQAYAQIVAARGPSLGGSARSVEEAVRFLQKQSPVGALVGSPGLTQAALSHVADTGLTGSKGHRGRDGSNVSTRASRYGQWDGRIGENIFYGRVSARDAIVALIVDEGVRDRYHRYNLYEKSFRFAGAAAGPHLSYGTMFVTDFAATYHEGGNSRTAGL